MQNTTITYKKPLKTADKNKNYFLAIKSQKTALWSHWTINVDKVVLIFCCKYGLNSDSEKSTYFFFMVC